MSKRCLRRFVSASPTLYRLSWFFRKNHRGVVDASTQVTIEGFPRSGNSFAVYAFWHANPDAVLAHHTHAVAQVRQSLKWRVPTVLLIRSPKEAVKSFLRMRSNETVAVLLQDYIDFYQRLWVYRNSFLIVDFSEVIDDMGSVIQRLNRRFSTNYRPFSHTAGTVAEVFQSLEAREKQLGGGQVRETHLARPRSEAMHEDIVWPTALLARAQTVYSEYRAFRDSGEGCF